MCVGTSQDPNKSFWAQTWNTPSALWASNAPASAASYADYVTDGDPCTVNGLELGIGYPRVLSQNTTYFLQSATLKGTQPQGNSTMSASVSLKSNDCNDTGSSPASWCMGLNSGRTPPVTGSQLFVGRSRNWLAPGCFDMATGWAAPTNSGPGVKNCPTKY